MSLDRFQGASRGQPLKRRVDAALTDRMAPSEFGVNSLFSHEFRLLSFLGVVGLSCESSSFSELLIINYVEDEFFGLN